jgi:hypothetical protein
MGVASKDLIDFSAKRRRGYTPQREGSVGRIGDKAGEDEPGVYAVERGGGGG